MNRKWEIWTRSTISEWVIIRFSADRESAEMILGAFESKFPKATIKLEEIL